MPEDNEFHDQKKVSDYTHYNPEDEHTAVIAKRVTKACQASQNVDIKKADRKGERANERLDDHEKVYHGDKDNGIDIRLSRLDDKETGKVTIMWNNTQEFQKTLRKYFYSVVVVAIFTIVANYIIPNPMANLFNKNQIEKIVKEVVKNMDK